MVNKSFVFSYLPIRKVLVLPFAGGVSPPLPVVSLLFSASYPQARRSYYLFFNYLFFNYLLGGPESAKNCRGGSRKRVDNSLESWLPVDNSCGGNRLSAGRGPRGLPRLRGAVRGKPYGGKGEIS